MLSSTERREEEGRRKKEMWLPTTLDHRTWGKLARAERPSGIRCCLGGAGNGVEVSQQLGAPGQDGAEENISFWSDHQGFCSG